MSEERELGVGERLLVEAGELPRHSQADSGREIVEPAPAVEGEELVVPVARIVRPRRVVSLKTRAWPVANERVTVRRRSRPDSRIDREHREAAPPDEIADRPVGADLGQVDARVAGQAAGLAQVGEDRSLVVALLDGARQLRHGEDRHVEVARQHLELT